MPPNPDQSAGDVPAPKTFAEQVLNTLGDCIKVLDLEGRLLMMNEPGMRLMEVDDFASCQSAKWSEFWEGETGDAARSALTLAKTGKPSSFEGPCRTMKGTPKYWHVLVTPILNPAGGVERVLVVSRDVTERRNAELAAKKAQDYAEAASRAKDDFLAILSHELRTPLSPVVMAISAMQQNPDLPPQVQRQLEVVRRNVELEVRLIDDMLDVSRVMNGKMRMHREVVLVHDILKDVTEICISDSQTKQIKVQHNLAATMDTVNADSTRLRQVFWNLLKNAVKFSGEGTTIRISSTNPTPDVIEVSILDEGMGIPPEALSHIFDPFDQGQRGTTRRFGGLGLGLAIVKAVVDLHEGEISAESEGKGKGAKFIVRLPVVSQEVQQVSKPTAKSPMQNLRMLIVEDHADTAFILCMFLKASGHDVKTACTVAEALKLAAQNRFDLILSDVGLPDATGYDLMRQVRDKFGVKGIAMSGYGMEEDIRKSHEAGFSEHVVKPVNFPALEQVIRRVVVQ